MILPAVLPAILPVILNESVVTVKIEHKEAVTIVSIDRPDRRNAVDGDTARALADAFRAFDEDDTKKVGILTGTAGAFCAGADLKAVAAGLGANPVTPPKVGDAFDRLDVGPMGPSRFVLNKPVIAAIEGHAVAGGLELALWCDMRVVSEDAVLGVFCRRWGVPLIDGGTVRLPRLIGQGHAMDLILTGRPVDAEEARMMGLANRIAPKGDALYEALKLAQQLCEFPQICMRHDRLSALEQWGLPYDQAMANEVDHGRHALKADEARTGAARFAAGRGRGGSFDKI